MNTENTTMTNDCKTCPVSTGTHKPAEAMHQQIAEPQPTALGYADAISAGLSYTAPHILALAADELRAQHARIAELEAELEAVGAGGVEPLRKPAAAPQAVQPSRVVPKAVKIEPKAHPATVDISWSTFGQDRPNINVNGWHIGGANLVQGVNTGVLIGLANMILDEAERQGHLFTEALAAQAKQGGA